MILQPHIAIRILRLCLVLFLPVLAAFTHANAAEPMQNVFDLNGRLVGTLAGTSQDQAANHSLDYTQLEYYDDPVEMLASLQAGEVDAILTETPIAVYQARKDPSLRRLSGVLKIDHFAFALRHQSEDGKSSPEDAELFVEVNSSMREMLANGTIDKMLAKWLDGNESAIPDPEPTPGSGKVLRVGLAAGCLPFSDVDSAGTPIGFDAELVRRIALDRGYRLEIRIMEYAQLLPSLFYGRVDMVGSCMTINEERRRLVQFTDSYYASGVTALVLAE